MQSLESDSEPEEITVESTKESLNQLFGNERKAIQTLKHLKKSKRKLVNDKYVEQKTIKNKITIEKLSQNLLNEINFDKNGMNEKKKDPIIRKTKEKKSKNSMKSISLETESTHFDVIDVNKDLSQLASNHFNKEKKNTLNFKDEMLFNKRRYKRMSTTAIKANFQKQHFK